MALPYNKKLVSTAQTLRRQMTPEEKHLWYDFLKKLPVTVNRQKNIQCYIVDFFIASKRVVIEIDGAQHKSDLNQKQDQKRDLDLAALNIHVLRYTNQDIRENFQEVCNDILEKLSIQASDMK